MMTPPQIRERVVVACEAEQPRELFVVVDGTLDVVDHDAVVGTQGPGSHAGAGCLLSYVVSDREFTLLLDAVPGLSERLYVDVGRAALEGMSPERAA
jgi:hypothetical protein